jgi:serralysin
MYQDRAMPVADQIEQQMLALINAERAAAGLQPLRLNSRLNASAEMHSQWMLNQDVFSHTGANGSTATARMQAAGYQFSGSWMSAENIAFQSVRGAEGYSDDVIDLHTALMNSAGHRANILTPNFSEVGIGIEIGQFTTSDGRTFLSIMVTQNFALSAADNGGDGSTTTGTGGGTAAANILGTDGANALNGTILGELLDGRGGNDVINGLGGNDTILGGAGNDRLFGSVGDDQMSGGSGSDRLYGETDNDRLDGDAGADQLYGGDGDDGLNGGLDNDRLWGGSGNDVMGGDAGADKMLAELGNDIMSGGDGNDLLDGGTGNDTLSGDAGNDKLTGGAGEDAFVFRDGFGADRVLDFADNVDTLFFAASYWQGYETAASFVDAYADISRSKVVFDFGDGDVVTVSGVQSLAQLYDDVMSIA